MMTELDVYLRGARNYVQGTQILGRTADWLTAVYPDRSLQLTAAKFTQLTGAPVLAAMNEAHIASDELTAVGSAQVRAPETGEVFEIAFHSRDGGKAPPLDDVPLHISNLCEVGRLGGRAHFETDGGLESLLSATVEFVKTLHANLAEHRGDVWFTSLASAELPIARQPTLTGTLIAEPQFERASGGRLLTLTEITAPGLIQPFLIGFSCRTS